MDPTSLPSVANQIGAYGAVAVAAGWVSWFLLKKHMASQESHMSTQETRIQALEGKVEKQYEFILTTLTTLVQAAYDRERELAKLTKFYRQQTGDHNAVGHGSGIRQPVNPQADTEILPQPWHAKLKEMGLPIPQELQR